MIYTFPTLSSPKFDSSKFNQTTEDPTIRTPIEGGYIATRARHTRRPRRTFKGGYTNLSEADRLLMETFTNTVKVGALNFYWTHPITNEVITCRFKSPPNFDYAGVGSTYRWNVSIDLEEV